MPGALIVAHGAPADPEPQEAALQHLAAQVGALLPGWHLEGATLAKPGALDAALTRLGPGALIYPFFMAQGWFTGRELPRRLTQAEATDARLLDPFGTDPALPALIAKVTQGAARDAGLELARTTLLLAAHGSKIARRSAGSTHAMAATMRRSTGFARVTVGFVEEAPFLTDAARDLGSAICLPFFALRAGHVTQDLPDALAQAGFSGPLLPAIGEHPAAVPLIAAALRRSVTGPGPSESPSST